MSIWLNQFFSAPSLFSVYQRSNFHFIYFTEDKDVVERMNNKADVGYILVLQFLNSFDFSYSHAYMLYLNIKIYATTEIRWTCGV